jgi:phosphohistidine swiveling domain-containing protein
MTNRAPFDVLLPAAPDELFVAQGGGKARNLAKLVKLGHRVPEFFCIPVPFFDAFVAANGLTIEVPAEGELATLAEEVDRRFVAGTMPDALRSAIGAALAAQGLDKGFVAVRSSGLDEDSVEHSFAGQFSSYMYRQGLDDVIDALKRCWASGYSERALSYRRERGLSVTNIRVGVVVQRMVDAEAAGVAFSRNAIALLDRERAVVSSVWGLGEGLVSGELDADHFLVHRDGSKVEATIVEKEHALRQAPQGGLMKVDVPEAQRKAPSLTEEQAKAVAKLVVELEKNLGIAQDCEWAIVKGELYLLQTRPITNLPPDGVFDACVSGREPILWDNSNIIESFCGVTSPLTFSHSSRAYAAVYEVFARVMGVPEPIIQEHIPMFRNMLGYVRGRIYYNLVSWYRLVFLFPGSATNAQFMETMMGTKEGLKPEIASLFEFTKNPVRYTLPQIASLAAKSIYRFATIDDIIADFMANVTRRYEETMAMDMDRMSLIAVYNHYELLNRELLFNWKAPIINDTRVMVFFGLLKKLTENWVVEKAGDEAASLQNDLLCGQGDLESTEPTKALMRIAKRIDEGDANYRAWYLGASNEERRKSFFETDRAHPIATAFREFVWKYGFRCVDEQKLEEQDLHDDPSFALEAIGSYVARKTYSIEEMEKREALIRDRAEGVIREKLSGFRAVVYNWVLKNARNAVRDRENLRFQRTKTFGLVRKLFRATGKKLFELGAIDHPRDVFFLTIEELSGFMEGRATCLDLRGIAAVRRAENERFKEDLPLPDRFITYGVAGASMQYIGVLQDADLLKDLRKSDDPNVLYGTPCCPGTIEGVVRVVKQMQDASGLSGEILVTERTDPGWVPLYPSCSGLLIERGSLLSHSAVVARELGLPTVVGISGGLMSKLKTGMRVRVDAGRGEVRILHDE